MYYTLLEKFVKHEIYVEKEFACVYYSLFKTTDSFITVQPPEEKEIQFHRPLLSFDEEMEKIPLEFFLKSKKMCILLRSYISKINNDFLIIISQFFLL